MGNVTPSGFDSNSWSQINQVTRTAIEAVADQVYDADGDNTGFDDVKAAYNQLSPEEQATFTMGAVLTGGAAPAVSLLAEEGVEVAQSAVEAAQEKYSSPPPEAEAAEKIKKAMQNAGDKAEEFVDDLGDGRVFRDAGKTGKRFIRDNFTERTPGEKLMDNISDAIEDAGDAISDFVDDVQDGRMARKIERKLDELTND